MSITEMEALVIVPGASVADTTTAGPLYAFPRSALIDCQRAHVQNPAAMLVVEEGVRIEIFKPRDRSGHRKRGDMK